MFHYVRNERDPLPRLHSVGSDAFYDLALSLSSSHEIVSLDTYLRVLAGTYIPGKPACLLTFDDGLADHYYNVFPVLADLKLPAVFFVPTAPLEFGCVLDVHKAHCLVAKLGFQEYAERIKQKWAGAWPDVDCNTATRKYRWDHPDVAVFKYRLNFLAQPEQRAAVLADLFGDVFGEEWRFAALWYASYSQLREMQAGGMSIGGHSHWHDRLGGMPFRKQYADLKHSFDILRDKCLHQDRWAFSYPFGDADSYDRQTVEAVRYAGFSCAFTSTPHAGEFERFTLGRHDPKDVYAVSNAA